MMEREAVGFRFGHGSAKCGPFFFTLLATKELLLHGKQKLTKHSLQMPALTGSHSLNSISVSISISISISLSIFSVSVIIGSDGTIRAFTIITTFTYQPYYYCYEYQD